MAEVDLDAGKVGLITRLNGSLKTYLAILLAVASLAASGAIWAFQVRENTKDIVALQAEIPNKQVTDLQLKNLAQAVDDLKKEVAGLREDQRKDIAALREETRALVQLVRNSK